MSADAKKNSGKPVIIMTGAGGHIGQALAAKLKPSYCIIGLDRGPSPNCDDAYRFDLADSASVHLALHKIHEAHGRHFAAVIHLAAYFDFSGEESPLYDAVNVEGTANLLQALSDYEVERFIYASTMLVHRPAAPGIKITEATPLEPKWIYPQSKYRAEKIVAARAGTTPYTILRLAGLYDDMSAVPTLAQQIARIYERDVKGHFYAGNAGVGQAFIHRDDMADAFKRVIDRRARLPVKNILLIGEDMSPSYEALQNRIGALLYGTERWRTLRLPAPVAKAAAWVEEKAEPIVPDDFDQGEKPFIRPFMIDQASDHYELDISRAKAQLDWSPRHRILDDLEELIANLRANPARWYRINDITPPDWLQVSAEKQVDADRLRTRYRAQYSAALRGYSWAHWMNAGLGLWLMAAPMTLGYESMALIWSDVLAGAAVLSGGLLSLSMKGVGARWLCAVAGLWLLAAPLVFWASTPAAYLNDTLLGALVIGFALLTPPAPGVSPAAAMTGPVMPPGWNINPSSWFQRLPIIILALVGFLISRYLAAYQLGHIDGVWEPFFRGGSGQKNGTEAIITSYVSEAWPVPDAGLGAMTYMLEILTGIMGTAARWRTMPWLVMLFGFMIVPLGAVSIFFIIIQPIWLGTYCTLCLIAAMAMLMQIPYSLDELVATGQFLHRRWKKGRPLLRVFFVGDSDDGVADGAADDFAQPPAAIVKDMVAGGMGVPWNLALAVLIGIWMMTAPSVLLASGFAADAHHLIGALVITVAVSAFAEVARLLRFLLIPLGAALLAVPFAAAADSPAHISAWICGMAVIALSFRRGPVYGAFGAWNRLVK